MSFKIYTLSLWKGGPKGRNFFQNGPRTKKITQPWFGPELSHFYVIRLDLQNKSSNNSTLPLAVISGELLIVIEYFTPMESLDPR